MIRSFILTGCMALMAFHATAQFVWKNPLPQGNELAAIWFTDQHTGFAAGKSGTIMKTNDDGATWEIRNLTDISLFTDFAGLSFPDPDTGFAVSRNGLVYRTTNAGETWDTIAGENMSYLNDIFFTSMHHGVVGGDGGFLYTTDDGGLTWAVCQHPSEMKINTIWFPDTDTGYCAGYDGLILKSTDGGYSWETNHMEPGHVFWDIRFSSGNTGLAVGDSGEMLRTTDGGSTWTKVFLGDTISFRSIGMFHPDTILLLGYATESFSPVSYPVMVRSCDGGITWTFLTHTWPVSIPWYISATPGGTAYVTGRMGILARSEDYGSTWTMLSTMLTEVNYFGDGIFAIDFPDESTGYALASGYVNPTGSVLKTTDGGKNWFQLDSLFTSQSLYAAAFTSSMKGYVGGQNIYSTYDGGQTWTCRYTGLWMQRIRSIAFNTPWTGIAVGEEGLFLRTPNSGQSWVPMTVVPGYGEYSYYCVFFVDDSVGYAGSSAELLRTNDGGLTWTGIYADHFFRDIFFTNRNTGYGITSGGVARKTIDGGYSWTPLSIPTDRSLFNVDFFDADTGFVSGYTSSLTSAVFKTTDAGETWQTIHIPYAFPLTELEVSPAYHLFTSSWYGALLGAHEGIYTGNRNNRIPESPDLFFLYPNPASGEVMIEFSENPTGYILSVSDLRGNTVLSTTVAHHRTKTTLSLSSLPAGVYLVNAYRNNQWLEVGKLVVTR